MKFTLTYFLLACGLITFSQRLQNVNVSLVNSQNQGTNSQVLVRFTLSPGVSCPGYEILWCTDSTNYLQIYNYAGICGNQNTSENFSFTHGSPAVETINYYKVSIPGFETSPVYRVYVGKQTPKPNILVYPNPVFNDSYIHLRYYNYSGTNVSGFIYNQFGMPVRPLDLLINNQVSDVNISDLNDGLYVVWVTDGTWLFRSKFIVKRT